MGKLAKQISLWIVLAVLVLLLLTKMPRMLMDADAGSQTDFVAQIDASNIESPVEVTIGETSVRVHARLKQPVGDHAQRALSFMAPEFRSEWEDRLNAQGVDVLFGQENTELPSMIFQVVLLLLIIGAFWFFMILQMKKNRASMAGGQTLVGKRGEKTTVWDNIPRGAVAETIDETINQRGRAILAGVVFDFDSARIQPESDPILEAVASYLNTYPYRTFYIVGHTAPSGPLDFQLSADRAQAVVDTLVNNFGIGSKRLEAQGVGPLVPVCNNATDDGRAANSRVELVER